MSSSSSLTPAATTSPSPLRKKTQPRTIGITALPIMPRRPALVFPERLSYSSLKAFLECPLQWSFSYLYKEKGRTGGPAFLGNTVHHVIDTYHRGLITPETAPDYYRVAWEEQRGLRSWVEWKDMDWGVVSPELQEREFKETFLRGRKLVQTYFSGPHRENVPLTLPSGTQATELNVEVPLLDYGGRRLKTFVAILDLIDTDGVIKDFKTKHKRTRLTQSGVEHQLQPLTQAWTAVEAGILTPSAKEAVPFRYLQLIHDFDRRTGQVQADYDARVGLDIPRWRLEKVSSMLLPGWIVAMEDFMDRVAAARDPYDVTLLSCLPGDHCRWCAHKTVSCPLYVESVI